MLRMLRDWAIALALAAAVVGVITALRPQPNLPDQAPELHLKTLDGERLRLADLRGRTVVLNFWASWCGPCRAEVPEFSKFAKDNPQIAVLGLAVDSGDTSAVRRAAKKFGIDYPVAVADSDTVSNYDVRTLPTTVIVDPEGRVHAVRVGALSYRGLSASVP